MVTKIIASVHHDTNTFILQVYQVYDDQRLI